MEFFSLKKKEKRVLIFDITYEIQRRISRKRKDAIVCLHVCTHISARINPYNIIIINEPALPIARAGFSNT